MRCKKVIVKCIEYNRGVYYGVFDITQEEFKKIEEIAEAIKKNHETWNWTTDWCLEKDATVKCGWKDVRKVYQYYPSLDRSLLDWFSEKIPDFVDSIEKIEVLEYERVYNLI